jgi:nucleoside-diphosphate-sugar epimerase
MLVTRRFTRGILLRMLVDAVAINVALIAAIGARFIGAIAASDVNADFSSTVVDSSTSAYLNAAPILTVLGIAAFYLSGIYTRGRAYSGRYKLLVILQAVTATYVIFGAISYLLFDMTAWFPRSVWLLGWLFTLVLIGGLRLGGQLWKTAIWAEAKQTGMPRSKAIRHVLVIGGAGFVGSVLTRKLLRRGFNVTVMDALVYGDEGLRDLYRDPRFALIKGDLRNIEIVIRSLQYADAVIHLGGLVGDPACDLDEKLTTEINLAANHLVGEAARALGVKRFVFASSCSVYGASDEILDERSVLSPVSLYARTKMDSEEILLDLCDDSGFAPVILRFGTFYGLSPRPRFDLVVNLLAAQATREKVVVIHGGDQWRPFVHVDDGAEAILRTLEAPVDSIRGEIFNVGSDEQNHQIAEIGDFVRDVVPDVEVVNEGHNNVAANYKVSCAKIQRQLNFAPRHTVKDGIREIKAVIERGEIPDYLEGRYSNRTTLSGETRSEFLRELAILPLMSVRKRVTGR